MIDAHMHFNLKDESPFDALMNQIRENEIARFVLILNTDEEKKLFYEAKDKLDTSGTPYSLVFLLKPGNEPDMHEFTNLSKNGLSPHIKFHPRLSNIHRDDFSLAAQTLERCPSNVIVVDCFAYGHKVETHIGINLALYLAEKFPEKKIVMAHSGGVDVMKAMLYSRTLRENIFFDLSLTCNYFAGSSLQQDIVHFIKFDYSRIMFGSDYPDFTSKSAAEITLQLVQNAGLSQEKQEDVFFNNAIKIYW